MIAVEIEEKLTRTIMVDANSYEEAEEKVNQAYYSGGIELCADNSNIEVACKDITEVLKKDMGEEAFEQMGYEL